MKRSLPIPSGFSTKDGRQVSFKDQQGQDIEELIIDSTTTFDLDKEFDSHNWNVLRLFCILNKTYGSQIVLTDLQAENKEAIERADKIFAVEDFIRSKKDDFVLLQKLYRRLHGYVEGISEAAIFRKLLEDAREITDKMLVDGKMIVDYEDFEFKAMVDLAIERGHMFREQDGTIKRHNGQIYAKDLDKAAHLLRTDDETRIYLQRSIEDVKPKATGAYKYLPEDSESVNLMSKIFGDGILTESKDDDDKKADSNDEIEINLSSFISAGLIEKTGSGPATRYIIGDLDRQFTKKELVAYFVKNQSQYEGFKMSIATDK